ncbi:MAG: glycosyltransferase family 4 protein [Firmicutes bacterium]|nr:glycosyltransferase family 4 protein [Bacillota bacterium]
MRILLLSEFFLSGQTTHVLDLTEQLHKLGHSVHLRLARVHTPLFAAEYAPRLKKLGITVSTGSSASGLNYLLRSFRPDVIHAHSSTLFSLAHRLAYRFQVPYVLTCHGLGFDHPKYKEDLENAAAVIAVGSNVAEQIKKTVTNLFIIANAVNTDYYVPPAPPRMRREIVYVGRIDEARIPGIKYLAKVLNAYFDHNLSIVGDRDPLVPGTIFHPWKTDLRPTLQQAGIVAACGRSAREALASGCAVLLMQRAYDGLISPALVCRPDFDFSGNQGRYPFSRLIQDLRVLLNSPAKLRKLQHWSRRYAEECLSSASAARQVAAVYEKVLQNPTRRPPYPYRLFRR